MRIFNALLTSATFIAAGGWVVSTPVQADEDWEDRLEDYQDDLEDYYDDLEDAYEDRRERQRDYRYYDYRGGGYYSGVPHGYYPQEYYLFGGHPSRYYYSYPDRYYVRPRTYAPYRGNYGYSNPNVWRRYNYGYRSPYDHPSGSYRYYRDGHGRQHRDRYRR